MNNVGRAFICMKPECFIQHTTGISEAPVGVVYICIFILELLTDVKLGQIKDYTTNIRESINNKW